MNSIEIDVVATGPSARLWQKRANIPVGTTNSGIHLVENPDFYWLTDDIAIQMFGKAAQSLTNAVHLDGSTHPYLHQPTSYHGGSSGVMLLRAMLDVCNPMRVNLYGFDGYSESEMTYKIMGQRRSRRGINQNMALAIARIFREHEEVDFIWHSAGPLKNLVELHRLVNDI